MDTVPIFSEPHEGPGPMNPPTPEPVARDRRPEYSPASVVLDVCAVLRRAGIGIEPGPNVMYTASIAAADLLRALGIKPTSAPER